jgi:hypothetical protein
MVQKIPSGIPVKLKEERRSEEDALETGSEPSASKNDFLIRRFIGQ